MFRLNRAPDATDATGGAAPVAAAVATETYDSVIGGLSESQRALILGELSKKNGEAQSLRTRASGSEAVLAKLKARFEVDNIDDAFLDNLQKVSGDKLTADEQIKQLQRKLALEAEAKTKLSSEVEGLTKSQRERLRDADVMDGIGKLGLRSEALSAARKLATLDASYDAETGKWAYDGKTLETYLAGFAKEHAYLLTNPVKPGVTPPGSVKVEGGVHQVISRADYEAMSPAERQANLKAINASVATWGKAGY